MENSTLVQQIKSAFPLLPLPEMSLHQAQLADQSMSRGIGDEEWLAEGARDSGRTWETFTEAELMACGAALSHLDESDFVYYLPAFLLLALRYLDVEWDHPAWAITISAVFAVTNRSGYSLSRFARFGPEQVAAVKAFLEAVARSSGHNAEDARAALDGYWNTDRAGKFLILPR